MEQSEEERNLCAAIKQVDEELQVFLSRRPAPPKAAPLSPIPQCSALFFLATRTEVAALKFSLAELGLSFEVCDGKYGEYYDLGTIGDDRVLAVRTKMGPLLEKGSAARALQYRDATGASVIIGIGMAFGAYPHRQRLGDVLISTGILPYDTRTVIAGHDGSPKADYSGVDRFRSHQGLMQRFDQFVQQNPFWRARVHRGLLLSGGARIHCAAFRDELVRDCGAGKGDSVVGGDMEGVGFLSSSTRAAPCWIVVKGICDFADQSRDDVIEQWRPIACYNAVRFVLGALRTTEN